MLKRLEKMLHRILKTRIYKITSVLSNTRWSRNRPVRDKKGELLKNERNKHQGGVSTFLK
jgi:hypothetical protein